MTSLVDLSKRGHGSGIGANAVGDAEAKRKRRNAKIGLASNTVGLAAAAGGTAAALRDDRFSRAFGAPKWAQRIHRAGERIPAPISGHKGKIGAGLAAGALATASDEHGGFCLTDKGADILKGRKTVRLRSDPLTPRERKRRGAVGGGEADERILAALKRKRMELAREEGVPAFVIFADRTLIDMAEKRPATLDEMLGVVDILSLHTPLTRDTNHILSRARIGLMKPEAIVVNVSRPELIEEDALVEAIEGGRLAGAALDVFESLPGISPRLLGLARTHRVLLTPHMASATLEARLEMGETVIVNIRAFVDGHQPPHRVLPETRARA